MKTTRRDFLKNAFWLTAGSLISHIPGKPAWAAETKKAVKHPDLVAVRDGSPVQMFETGIRALGGMDRFVKKGQTVLVKPNIGWNKTPTEGATTNPELVGAVIASARQAGAKAVYVFDHTCDREKSCYDNSGIARAAKDNGGEVRSGSDKDSYREVEVPGGKVLKKVLVHELYLESDVVINVPVLKSHGGGRITASLKNLMGVVWDRGYWHGHGLHECIAEFPLVRKPDLNIIDAYLVMMKNGPRGLSTEDLELWKMQLLSTDMVLADAAGAKVLGLSSEAVSYLGTAEGLGLGTTDLEKRDIRRISLKTGKPG